MVTMWTHWYRIFPDYSLESWSWSMVRRNCTHIIRFCTFAGRDDDGGVRKGGSTLGVLGSGIDRMFLWSIF